MKKIVTATIIVLLLAVVGVVGYGVYSANAKSMPENYYGKVSYVETDKSEVREYVNDFYSHVYHRIRNNRTEYNNDIHLAGGETAAEIRAGGKFIDRYTDLYEAVVGYHQEFAIPLQMKDTHEKLLESLYYADRISRGFSDAYKKDDLSQIEEWFDLSEETLNTSVEENPHLVKRKNAPGFDYLTNQ